MRRAWRLAAADGVSTAAAAALIAVVGLYLALPLGVPFGAPSAAGGAGPAGHVAVADVRGHALVLLDLARAEEPARVALPGAPHELIELADGRIVASLGRAGALAVVTPGSGHVEVLAIGGIPHGLALESGPGGPSSSETLYVTDRSRDLVRRLRVADWSEGEPLPAGALPHGVAVLGGGMLAVVNAGDATLQLGERLLAVPALPESVAAASGRVAVAAAHGGTVEVFDPSGTPLTRAEVGGRPVRVAFDRAGAWLAAALSASGEVALIDRDGVVRRVHVGGVPDGIAFTADSRWLLVGDLFGGSLALVDVPSGALRGRIEAGDSAGAVLLREDGATRMPRPTAATAVLQTIMR